MVSVTSEEQFYAVAQFAIPDSYVGDMFDVYEESSVVVVDDEFWSFINFEKSLDLKEKYGYPISFEEFEMRYLETAPTNNVMTHENEVKTMKDNTKDNNTIHANIGSKTWDKYMEELNKEGYVVGDSTMSKEESKEESKVVSGVKIFQGTDADLAKIAKDMINHPSHYNQFSREVIDTMQGVSTPEEFKGYLKLNAIKYLSRYQGKNGVEDLSKSVWYINKLKEVVENEKDSQTK